MLSDVADLKARCCGDGDARAKICTPFRTPSNPLRTKRLQEPAELADRNFLFDDVLLERFWQIVKLWI